MGHGAYTVQGFGDVKTGLHDPSQELKFNASNYSAMSPEGSIHGPATWLCGRGNRARWYRGWLLKIKQDNWSWSQVVATCGYVLCSELRILRIVNQLRLTRQRVTLKQPSSNSEIGGGTDVWYSRFAEFDPWSSVFLSELKRTIPLRILIISLRIHGWHQYFTSSYWIYLTFYG